MPQLPPRQTRGRADPACFLAGAAVCAEPAAAPSPDDQEKYRTFLGRAGQNMPYHKGIVSTPHLPLWAVAAPSSDGWEPYPTLLRAYRQMYHIIKASYPHCTFLCGPRRPPRRSERLTRKGLGEHGRDFCSGGSRGMSGRAQPARELRACRRRRCAVREHGTRRRKGAFAYFGRKQSMCPAPA